MNYNEYIKKKSYRVIDYYLSNEQQIVTAAESFWEEKIYTQYALLYSWGITQS